MKQLHSKLQNGELVAIKMCLREHCLKKQRNWMPRGGQVRHMTKGCGKTLQK